MASISTNLCLPLKSRHFSLSTNLALKPPIYSSTHYSFKPHPFHRQFHLSAPIFIWRFTKSSPTRASSSTVVRAAFDVAGGAIRPGGAVESDQLPSDLRRRTMSAIESLGGRVTVGDVASKAGLKLDEAQRALQAIASDTNGFLEVSDEGDVLYVFQRDYRSKLATKSVKMKIEPWIEKAKSAAEYLVRVSFGTALIASIILVYTTIIALVSSSRSEDDSRGRRGRAYDSGFTFYFNPTDLFWYWDPYYYRRPQKKRDDEGMNFIESVFSFVFGDGDPNQGIEEERWKLIGQYIASNGGVVTAEELAPYLDVETTKDMNDESYMLPVLLRFDGQPEVDDEGNILYQFPSLQTTASSQRSGRKEYVGRKWSEMVGGVEKFFREKKWQFSKASNSERAMVIGLGALNLFGVLILGTMLKQTVRSSGFISYVSDIFPLLQIYAGSFFAIPMVRWFFIRQTNAQIEKRNQARKARAQALELPDISLRRKLLSARDMAQKRVIGRDQIIYSTEKDLVEQDYDARDWERRFREIKNTE